jgi:hypothetical protein
MIAASQSSPIAKPQLMRLPALSLPFSGAVYRYSFSMLFFLLCMIFQITHDSLFSSQLNLGAEDGGYIYADALQYPFWRTWLAPMVLPDYPPMGYLLLLQRVIGSIAALFPPAWGPQAVYVGTYALHVLSAMYILSNRFSVYVPPFLIRALIALYIVFLPTLGVYRGSVTGSIQYLFVPMLALLAASPADGKQDDDLGHGAPAHNRVELSVSGDPDPAVSFALYARQGPTFAGALVHRRCGQCRASDFCPALRSAGRIRSEAIVRRRRGRVGQVILRNHDIARVYERLLYGISFRDQASDLPLLDSAHPRWRIHGIGRAVEPAPARPVSLGHGLSPFSFRT